MVKISSKIGLSDSAKHKWIDSLKERLDMYDMMIANMIAGNSIIEPEEDLDNSKISIGYSNIASESQLSKYFMVKNLPDYLKGKFMDTIRSKCITAGTKINFYMYGQPHKIRWDSAEMRNKMQIWKEYADTQSNSISVFEYRNKRDAGLAKERIIRSTKYLNESELDHKRTTFKVTILIEISSKRDEQSLLLLSKSLKLFKETCYSTDIKFRELKVNMIDWMSYFGIFSLKQIKEVSSKVSKKILTDDIIANLNSYKQGRIGRLGVPLGIDVESKQVILKVFKADPDAADNWLISAVTGGGKSYFIKVLISYLMAAGFVVTVMDYEGDEYYNMANYIKAGNPDDVKIISMGKGSAVYFDPMEIADLTGDEEVDADLKENAIAYTLSIFRLIACGIKGELNQWEEKIVSTAIKRVYDEYGVTDNKATWIKSNGLRIRMVYEKIKEMARTKEYIDDDMDSIKHKAAVKIAEAASTYFEEGEAKSGTFKQPMSANELYKAKFVVFSFGMKGANSSQIDPTILALKQLSVANVSIQISNYCKYVLKCFNVKVWEEYQRWGEAEGSAEIISNAMTGGRKRGDVNLLITNDLQSILDDNNSISTRIRQNITSYAIGGIKDKDVRHKFCEKFSLLELETSLELIAKANSTDATEGKNETTVSSISNKYKHSFCLVLDNGKKGITKVMLPKSLKKSAIFRTGVDISKKNIPEVV